MCFPWTVELKEFTLPLYPLIFTVSYKVAETELNRFVVLTQIPKLQ